jgi:hypothetical protein
MDKGVVTVAGRGGVLVVRSTSMRKGLPRGAPVLNCYTASRNMEDVGTGRARINGGAGTVWEKSNRGSSCEDVIPLLCFRQRVKVLFSKRGRSVHMY